MAYKFQLGVARLSGSTTFEEALAGLGALDITGLSSLDGGVDVNGSNFTVGTDGAVVGTSLNVSTGAITNASTISGSGLIQGGTLTAGGIQFQGAGQVRATAGTFALGDNDLTTTGTGQFGPVKATTLSGSSNLSVAGNAAVQGDITGSWRLNINDRATIGSLYSDGAVFTSNGTGAVSSLSFSGSAAVTAASFAADGAAVLGGSATASSFKTTDVTYGDTGITMDSDGGHFTIEQDDADKSVRVVLGAAGAATSGFQVRNSSNTTLWGVTDDGAVSGSGNWSIAGYVNAQGNVSGSSFYGDGSNLTNVSSDSVDVSDSSANSEFRLIGVAASGDGVTLVTMDTAADLITMNASTGKLTLAGPGIAIGSADITEAEFEFLDGASAGSAVASKVLVVDASRDLDNLNDVAAAGLTLSDLTSGRLPLVSTSGLLADNALFGYATDRSELDGYVSLYVSSSASGSAFLGDGVLFVADGSDNDVFSVNQDGAEFSVALSGTSISGSSTLRIADGAIFGDDILPREDGVVDLGSSTKEWKDIYIDGVGYIDELQAAALGADINCGGWAMTNVNLDSGNIDGVAIGGASQSTGQFTTLSASSTLSVGGPVTFAADLHSQAIFASGSAYLHGNIYPRGATDVTVVNNADSILYYDATDLSMKRDTIADFVSNMAGAGISAAAGVLSVSAVGTPTAFGDAAAVMVEGLNYASATLTAARVLTLPDSDDLDVGEFVKIKMAAGVSASNYASIIIKVGSGDLIDGDASIRLESPYAAVNLYKVATNVWRIL